MAYTTAEVTDKAQWEAFVATRDEANFLHSWMWAETHEALGKKIFRFGYYNDDTLVGVAISVIEPAKRGKYMAIAAGPLLDWDNQGIVDAWRDSVYGAAKKEGCVFVRVRPQLEDSQEIRLVFKKLGFKPAQMHLEAEMTSQLLLDKPIEDLQKNMRKNTRREIKQAKKKGIRVTQTTDPAAIREFYEVQLKTAQRHDFVPFSYDKLHEEFIAFAATDSVLLYSSHTSDGQLIAQAFVIFYGNEASYHYGASTELGREEPGAAAIQWKAIKEAIHRGCTRYNFWGVVHPEDTDHRFYGVSVFKRGFRGVDVEYLHAHDLIINKPAYLKNYLVEFFRKRSRHV